MTAMRIEHLIYDFDGTIANSYSLFLRFWLEIAERHHISLPCDHQTLYRALKHTGWDAYCALQCEDIIDYPTFMDEFHALQEAHRMDFLAYPAAETLLRDAVAAGKKNYRYTHTGPVVKDMLANMGLLDCFTFILDASYGFPLKPAPDALRFLLSKFALDPDTCIMIGDRPIDTQAGRNAGIRGCLWDEEGLFSPEDADYYIKELSELAVLVRL